MKLSISPEADHDIRLQCEYLDEQSGELIAMKFTSALADAFGRIARWPHAGKPCEHSRVENVRRVRVRGFPAFLAFYQVRNDRVIILRVLHGARSLEHLL